MRVTPPPHGGRLRTIRLVALAARPWKVACRVKVYVAPGESAFSRTTRLRRSMPVVEMAARSTTSSELMNHASESELRAAAPPGRATLPRRASFSAGF